MKRTLKIAITLLLLTCIEPSFSQGKDTNYRTLSGGKIKADSLYTAFLEKARQFDLAKSDLKKLLNRGRIALLTFGNAHITSRTENMAINTALWLKWRNICTINADLSTIADSIMVIPSTRKNVPELTSAYNPLATLQFNPLLGKRLRLIHQKVSSLSGKYSVYSKKFGIYWLANSK